MQQRSPDWFAARLGKVTASRIADVMAKTKTGYSTSRANYAAQLVAERLTGNVAESYSNAAMQWGTDQEPNAKAAYEWLSDVEVVEVGFIQHPDLEMAGASPDGLVGDDGLVEIKCPITATHINTLLKQTIDKKYLLQMMWQMDCTGRKWCDFVSFDPRLPENMQLWVKRVERDDKLIAEIRSEINSFLEEVGDTVIKLSEMFEEKQ